MEGCTLYFGNFCVRMNEIYLVCYLKLGCFGAPNFDQEYTNCLINILYFGNIFVSIIDNDIFSLRIFYKGVAMWLQNLVGKLPNVSLSCP